ncbi:MAG: GtrA family protein [Actinobacteria bacterium]|nr:GtrA family protein [Actinomycetota bacterium]
MSASPGASPQGAGPLTTDAGTVRIGAPTPSQHAAHADDGASPDEATRSVPAISPDSGDGSGGRERPAGRRLAGLPPWLRQFVKFAIVGGTGTVVNLTVFSIIIYAYVKAAGSRPLLVEQVASGIAFCVAVVSNFVLNRRWTFRHTGPLIPHFGRFFLVSCVGLALNVLLYTMLHEHGGLGEHLSELLAIACVMPMNFLGSKLWAFR